MRFGISATSWIFPKNFLTRLRPINVCAIVLSLLSSGGTGTTLRKAAIHRDYLDRRTWAHLLDDSGLPNRRLPKTAAWRPYSLPLNGKDGDSGACTPKSPVFVCNPWTIPRDST